MINGGYILQPRIIEESDINVAPPYVREIWSYLLREANSKDKKYGSYFIKRGQLFRSYDDIREGLKWYVGWRKCTYNENHTKKAMKFLRETGRITTTKELGGVLITICKYDYYQNPKNYERTDERTEEGTIEEPLKNQPLPDNNKNDKNNKNNKEEIIHPQSPTSGMVKANFIGDIIKVFGKVYQEAYGLPYVVAAAGKESSAAGYILKIYKEKYPEAKTEEALIALENFFRDVVTIDDAFIQDNMSLPTIRMKFPQITKMLKNGKYKERNGKGATGSDILNSINKVFAEAPKN